MPRSLQAVVLWPYPERVLDLGGIDVDEIATALADQTDFEQRWLIDPRTGQVAFWTSDTGIDGQNPVDIDELDLIPIDPLPPSVWFRDMADFADGISDATARRKLTQALQGRGAFRRFRNQLYEHQPDLISPWHSATRCPSPTSGRRVAGRPGTHRRQCRATVHVRSPRPTPALGASKAKRTNRTPTLGTANAGVPPDSCYV